MLSSTILGYKNKTAGEISPTSVNRKVLKNNQKFNLEKQKFNKNSYTKPCEKC